MAEGSGTSYPGLRITGASVTDAQVAQVEVNRASFWRVRVRGAWIGEVRIDGHIGDLRIRAAGVHVNGTA